MALSKGKRVKKSTKKQVSRSKKKGSKKKASGASKKASKKKASKKKPAAKITKKAAKKVTKKTAKKVTKKTAKKVTKKTSSAFEKAAKVAKNALEKAAKKATSLLSAAIPEAAPKKSKASKKASRSSAKAASVGKSTPVKRAKPVARPAELDAVPAAPVDTWPETESSESDDSDPVPDDGDPLPRFRLRDQAGAELSLEDLSGAPFVLYFYPKDDTPGCTTEACTFNSELEPFSALGVRVIGVSPDSTQSHAKFSSKYELKFTLLSDPKHELSKALGVYAKKQNYGREYLGIVRSTFLVDADGVIRKSWRGVRVAGHVPQVLAAAAQL